MHIQATDLGPVVDDRIDIMLEEAMGEPIGCTHIVDVEMQEHQDHCISRADPCVPELCGCHQQAYEESYAGVEFDDGVLVPQGNEPQPYDTEITIESVPDKVVPINGSFHRVKEVHYDKYGRRGIEQYRVHRNPANEKV